MGSDAAALHFGVCAVGRDGPDLLGESEHGPQGDGHDHARAAWTQATELNPLNGPVQLQGISVP